MSSKATHYTKLWPRFITSCSRYNTYGRLPTELGSLWLPNTGLPSKFNASWSSRTRIRPLHHYSINRVISWINEYGGLVCGFRSPSRLSCMLTGRDLPDLSQASFFDVPLHDNFWRASEAGPKYDLRKIFDNTVVSLRPKDAVTFVDNHE